MLALKQALSLNTLKKTSGGAPWEPTDETSCEVWWENKEGISLYGTPGDTDRVYGWVGLKYGGGGHLLMPHNAAESPTYDAATGALTFDPSEDAHLSLPSTQISLTGEFTIGMRLHVAAAGGIIIGDNTTAGEFVKLFSNSILRVKIDNTLGDLELDSGTWFSDSYLVITRDSSNVLNLWWNGVEQGDTTTISGTADIDTLGVRKTDLNPYDGSISEVQIFSSTSATLTANVNARLASL
jgi:hypothetical protein